MLGGIEENSLKTGKHKFKLKYFPGACTDDIYDYIKPLFRKLPDDIILHIGTKDTFDNTSREILEKNLKLITYIQEELSKCKITMSTPIKRHNHRKACQKFIDLRISFVYNSKIGVFSYVVVVSISTTKP